MKSIDKKFTDKKVKDFLKEYSKYKLNRDALYRDLVNEWERYKDERRKIGG